MEPRTVMPRSTTSKMGSGSSPLGKPTMTIVPPRRAMPTADLKAPTEGARHSTAWDPPCVAAVSLGTSSGSSASKPCSAPSLAQKSCHMGVVYCVGVVVRGGCLGGLAGGQRL